MQTIQVQDASTQAMTEVALGLSMAFFAILILALLSIGVPIDSESTPMQTKPEQSLSLRSTQNEPASHPGDEAQFVFYHDKKLYDQNLTPFDFQEVDLDAPLYLAVPAQLDLTKIMQLRQEIQHPNLAITLLTERWQTQLEQLP